MIGPEIPAHLLEKKRAQSEGESERSPSESPESFSRGHDKKREEHPEQGDDEDSDDEIGPKPAPSGTSHNPHDGVREFIEREERRQQLVDEAAKPKKLQREEWMLVPPTSSDLLGSIDPTKLKPRQFRATAAPTVATSNNLWTETPAERQRRIADEVSGKRRRAANADADADTDEDDAQRKLKKKRDEEIRREVEEHNRRVRGSSLLSQHSSKLKASSEKDEEQAAIWEHDRDMGLGSRLLDDDTRSKIVKEARGLGDRFSSGKGGGFLGGY